MAINVAHLPHASAADIRTPLVYLARLGYASRGVVYLIVGTLAVLAALGHGKGETTGTRGALALVGDQPFGQVALVILGVGLLAYALWRFLQAYYDVDGHGRDAKGMAVRVGLLISGAAHVILGVWVFTALLAGGDRGNEGEGRHRWVAWALELPAGPWIVGLVGAIVIGVGVAHLVKGYKSKFEKRLSFDYQKWPWARTLCRFGLMARGVVFGIIGWFIIQAAIQHEPGRTGGLAEVLSTLQNRPWGWAILGIMALGLISFGIYSFVEAVYRRISTPRDLASAPG